MKTFRALTLLLGFAVLFGASVGAAADSQTKVYQCHKDGKRVFSQLPCNEQSQPMQIKSSQDQGDPKAVAKMQQQTEAITKAVAQQDKARQIKRHQRRVAQYKQQMAVEFGHIQHTRYRTKTEADQALKALGLKYKVLIDKEHEAIKQLRG